MKKRAFLFGICFTVLACCTQHIYAESKDAVLEAKNGIVEIFSGFLDKDGAFWKIKSGSGFLVSNSAGETYIVANSSIVKSSGEEKQQYCKAHEIDADDYGMADVIRIVVTGDVTAEVSVLTKSEMLDFCILSMSNVINEKIPLKLGDSKDLKTGETVYALGFPENMEGLSFSPSDVEIYQGTIQDTASMQGEAVCIQHSAVISGGNTGGPLLDGDGYVVGMNCMEYTDLASGRYYALPVKDLKEVLDNFAIPYGSKKRDQSEIVIVIYALAGLIVLLLAWVLWLFISMKNLKKYQPEGQSSRTSSAKKVNDQPKEDNEAAVSKSPVQNAETYEDKTIGIVSYQTREIRQALWDSFSQRTTNLEIIRKKDGQKVLVDKENFILGKNPNQSDWFLSGNPTISRIHARIHWENDAYAVVDLGSSNGTYINDEKLSEKTPARLKGGDLLTLADEDFLIHIYKVKPQEE